MFRSAVVLLATFLMFVPGAFAKSQQAADAIEIDTYEKYQSQVTDIRSEMIVGGRYEYLKGVDRNAVNQKLDAMAALLQASGSVDDMPPAARTTLMADQQTVNEMLARFADNRVICTHEAPIGSLIPKKTCRTLRQIEKSRSGSMGSIMDIQKNNDIGAE